MKRRTVIAACLGMLLGAVVSMRAADSIFGGGSGGGTFSGSLADTQVAYGSGADTIAGSSGLTWLASFPTLVVTTTSTEQGLFVSATKTGAAGIGSGGLIGASMETEHTGTIPRWWSLDIPFDNNGTGDITDWVGTEMYLENHSTGDITRATSYMARVYNDNSGGSVGTYKAFASFTDGVGAFTGDFGTFISFYQPTLGTGGSYGAVQAIKIEEQSGLTVTGANQAFNYADKVIIPQYGGQWIFPGTLGGAPLLNGTGILNSAYGTNFLPFVLQYDPNTYYGIVQLAGGANSYGVYNEFVKSRTTNGTTRATANNGDQVMFLESQADNGTSLFQVAQVYTSIAGSVGAGTWPGKFGVALGDGTTIADELSLTSSGMTVGSVITADGFLLTNGASLKTDTTTAHTALIQAYDVDGAARVTFGTLTNGNTPDLTLSAPAGTTMTLQPSTYKSADGTTGATVTTCTGFKNGLCISGT